MESIPTVDGLILASDLRRMGLDARQYRRACERGEVVRIHRGVFVAAEEWRSLKPSERYLRQVMGAARASRTTAVVSHASAVALWGAPLIRVPRLVHVLSSTSVGTRVENGFRRHASEFRDFEVTDRCGLRVTSLPRTMVEFVRDAQFQDAVVALDWALRASSPKNPEPVTTKAEIMRVADGLGVVRGRRKLERALEFADGRSGSPGESVSRAMMLELGFPRPELQIDFTDHRGFVGTVDFWWPDFNLIGEFDGVGKYIREEFTKGKSAAEVVIEEKNRENRLRAPGRGMTRWDWAITRSPSGFSAHLSAAGLPSSRYSR